MKIVNLCLKRWFESFSNLNRKGDFGRFRPSIGGAQDSYICKKWRKKSLRIFCSNIWKIVNTTLFEPSGKKHLKQLLFWKTLILETLQNVLETKYIQFIKRVEKKKWKNVLEIFIKIEKNQTLKWARTRYVIWDRSARGFFLHETHFQFSKKVLFVDKMFRHQTNLKS